MRFRILGPLEVTQDGVPVAIGGSKPRVLLAALLLRPGVVVSTDRLVAVVWGDDPPRDAVGALRAYVSRLRTVLQPAGADERLRYRAPGYVLTVLEDELDAAQFSSRVSEARDHASAADHRRAADLLESALALWRGDALAEFDPARLDADADLARLAELRLVATEEHAQALLQLGRGREVVTELEALVRRFPERERLTVLLMRALYGSGRQADALSAYQRLRRHLVQELGVEPSEPTRAIHRQLLEHDPTLTRRTPARRRTCPAAAPASWAGRTRSAGWPMCCRPARW